MKKISTILNRSLTLLIMLILFYLSLLPKNTNAQIRPPPADIRKEGLDPFSQPDMGPKIAINKYDYYGSGDVNNDGVIDFNDVSAMQNGETNDRADVNGDDTTDVNDIQLLTDYLNGNVRYLPAHWNYLNGIEKRNWIQKMLAIDSVNYNPYISDGDSSYTCENFSREMLINNFGVDSLENYSLYWKYLRHGDENARFNIPVYMVSTQVANFTGHVINGVLVGPNDTTHFQENPLNFNEWYFFEPQNDNPVSPGDWDMNANGYVKIKWWGLVISNGEPYYFNYRTLVEFDLNNGEASVNWYNPYLVLSNPNDSLVSVENQGGLEEKVKNFELGNAYPNPTNGYVNIPYKTAKALNLSFEIYNALGELVERAEIGDVGKGSHNFSYELTALPSGVYLIRAKSGAVVYGAVKVINMK